MLRFIKRTCFVELSLADNKRELCNHHVLCPTQILLCSNNERAIKIWSNENLSLSPLVGQTKEVPHIMVAAVLIGFVCKLRFPVTRHKIQG